MDNNHGQKYQAKQHIKLFTLKPSNIDNTALHKGALQPTGLTSFAKLPQLSEEDHNS